MSGLDDASIISTRRLALRPLRVDDAGEMASVLADPALHEFTGGEPATIDELRDRYVTWVRGSGSRSEIWLNWIVRRIVDSAAIGTVQATIVSPDAAPVALVAWTIGTAWQRQGFATEATRGLVQGSRWARCRVGGRARSSGSHGLSRRRGKRRIAGDAMWWTARSCGEWT